MAGHAGSARASLRLRTQSLITCPLLSTCSEQMIRIYDPESPGPAPGLLRRGIRKGFVRRSVFFMSSALRGKRSGITACE